MSWDMDGGPELAAKLHLLQKRALEGAKEGLRLAGEHVLGESNERVPYEEGDLARSGGVSQDERTGETAISYDTPYAVRQHEDMSLHHDEGRMAKYLELSVVAAKPVILQLIARSIKRRAGL